MLLTNHQDYYTEKKERENRALSFSCGGLCGWS